MPGIDFKISICIVSFSNFFKIIYFEKDKDSTSWGGTGGKGERERGRKREFQAGSALAVWNSNS